MSKKKSKNEKAKNALAEEVEAQEVVAPVVAVQTPFRERFAKEEQEEERPKLWLITFTDVVALMLTFFVMLYSMAVPDIKQWEQMTDALNFGLSKLKSPQWYFGPQDEINIDKITLDSALDLGYLAALAQDIIDKDALLKTVDVIHQKERLILSIPAPLLFEGDSAEINVEGKRALFKLGEALSRIRNRVEVLGHTDPRLISEKNATQKNNWALSLARASQVALVLDSAGYQRAITIKGLSSGHYEELSGDLSEAEKLALSRRVDIIIMKDDGSLRTFLNLDPF